MQVLTIDYALGKEPTSTINKKNYKSFFSPGEKQMIIVDDRE